MNINFRSKINRLKNTNENDETINDLRIQKKENRKSIGEKIKNILRSRKKLFCFLLIFRIINSQLNHTSYVPDEYWQSVEVAHKWIFDIGYLTWEWLPEVALRSPLYPILFAIPFKFLSIFGLDNRLLLIKLPLITHGLLAAVGDYYLYLFAFKLSGAKVAQWTLFNQLINWFTFYSCTRTLVNNIEWVLVILVLYEYKTIRDSNSRVFSRKFLTLIGICFILRPTGLVVFLPICIFHLLFQCFNIKNSWKLLRKTFRRCILIGTITMTISLLIDKQFYGKWTCSQWNFLHFNLLTDISQNYGVHPWHWYFSNAIPSMVFTQLVILAVSLWTERSDDNCRYLLGLSCLVLYFYSFLGHKEFRFIFPLMPIAMYLIGRAFVRFPSKIKLMAVFLIITQIPMAFYMCLIHQRGVKDVVMAVGRNIEKHQLKADNFSVVFLMPCHSTPWLSHIHHNVSARFLTCDPQITGGVSFFGDQLKPSLFLKSYDEADLFYSNPIKWLLEEYENLKLRPSHFVLFEQLNPEIEKLLTEWQYQICKIFFHAHFPTHSKHSRQIIVYCLKNNNYF